MATALHTARLFLRPFGLQDFERFVTELLTDPAVEFYIYQYHLRPADALVH